MNKRFAKFTEVEVDLYNEESTNELMLDISIITAIRSNGSGTEIVTSEENFIVTESFNDVRKILAI